MNLTNKQIKKLRSLANTITNKYQIGKDGVDQDVITLLSNALKAHELIKVYFNKSVVKDISQYSNKITKLTDANLVAKIGHMIIIYKPNPNKKNHIEL